MGRRPAIIYRYEVCPGGLLPVNIRRGDFSVGRRFGNGTPA